MSETALPRSSGRTSGVQVVQLHCSDVLRGSTADAAGRGAQRCEAEAKAKRASPTSTASSRRTVAARICRVYEDCTEHLPECWIPSGRGRRGETRCKHSSTRRSQAVRASWRQSYYALQATLAGTAQSAWLSRFADVGAVPRSPLGSPHSSALPQLAQRYGRAQSAPPDTRTGPAALEARRAGHRRASPSLVARLAEFPPLTCPLAPLLQEYEIICELHCPEQHAHRTAAFACAVPAALHHPAPHSVPRPRYVR